MDEDSIFRNRLLVDERLLRKLSKRSLQLLSLEDGDQRDLQLQSLYTEQMQHEFQLKKIGRMIGANSTEIQFYQTKQQELEAAIQEQQQEVLRLKAALEAEKRIRVNKQEYERIVETISKYRSRPDQLSEIAGFDAEGVVLQAKQAEIQATIDRFKQEIRGTFGLLSATIDRLSDEVRAQQP